MQCIAVRNSAGGNTDFSTRWALAESTPLPTVLRLLINRRTGKSETPMGPHFQRSSKMFIGVAGVLLCALALWSYSPHAAAPAQSRESGAPVPASAGSVEIQMKNVDFRLARDIVLEVGMLRGRLQRTRREVPVTFDDGASFTVEIDSARVAITPASLGSLMNSYVLACDGAPISKVTMTINGDKLMLNGTIHKGLDLPFEMEGSLSTTDDGNIRLHAAKIKAAHVPVKGMLHLLGENLSKLVNQNAGRGMTIQGDDIILTPATLTSPPHFAGKVTNVSIEGNKIVEVFESGRHPEALVPPVRAAAYIYHRGGVLRFGKLTMNDADLEIVGDKPARFDFFLREYQKQLIAGYSKNTAAGGLIAHMVDSSRFSPAAASPRASGLRPGN
jgi:hypothetical protein